MNEYPYVMLSGSTEETKVDKFPSLAKAIEAYRVAVFYGEKPTFYQRMPERLPEVYLALPRRSVVRSMQLNKDEAARRFYPGVTFDTALPADWVREYQKVVGENPVPDFVYGYPKGHAYGIPLPLCDEAMLALQDYTPWQALSLHTLFGSKRHAGMRSMTYTFSDQYFRELEVEVFYSFSPGNQGYYGLPEESEEAYPPKVEITCVELYPAGTDITHLLSKTVLDELEAAALKGELEGSDYDA